MNRIYALTVALLLTCFFGRLSAATLFEQTENEETSSTTSSNEDKKTKSLNLSLHLRSAYHSNFAGKPMKFQDAGFRFDHVMIDFNGHVTPKLSYRYLQRLNKVSPIMSKENLPTTIDYAYLKYAFNDRFSMTAGKQVLIAGGFEYNKYPIDVYDYNGITSHIACYLNGLQVAYTPSESQELLFQIVNNRLASWEEAIGTPQQGLQLEAPTIPLYYSLGWNSNYFDNALQLRYGVNFTQPAKGKNLFMVSGGQLWQSGPFSIYFDFMYQRSEVDYLGAIRNLTSNPQNVVEYVDYLTLLGEINYRFTPKWNLLLKSIYNNYSIYKSGNYLEKGNCLKSLNYQAGIEYYPMGDDNLHLFLTTTLKNYNNPTIADVMTPENTFRLSAGFVYRLPVLSFKR